MDTLLDLTPGRINLKVYARDGDTITFDFGAVDKSSFTYVCGWKQSLGDDDTTFKAWVVDTSQAATGKIIVTISKAVKATMSKKGMWDLQQKLGSNDPDTLFFGSIEIVGDVSP